MNYYEEMEKELQERYPKLFNSIDPIHWSLLANTMHEFLDVNSDESNHCSFIDVYNNKQDAISSHIDRTKKHLKASMKTVSEKNGIYLVYAIDP